MGNAEYMGIHTKLLTARKSKKNNFLKKKLFNKPMEYNNIVYHEVPVEYEEQQTYECFVPRVQKGGSIGKRRPGKEATLPDSALSREELDRRNNRRRRNREAAARVRDRRTGKMKHLENEVQQLKKEQKNLEHKNQMLREELRKLKNAGNSGSVTKSAAKPVHRLTHQISNTEPPAEMPIVPKLENMSDVFHVQNHPVSDANKVLFTPGGTFVLTPVRQDIRFDFPEAHPVRHRSASDGDYKRIIQNL